MGKNLIRACAGTACHVSGSKMIIETTCIGCCSLAPVIMVNDDTHGRLTPAMLRKLLREYKRAEERSGDLQ